MSVFDWDACERCERIPCICKPTAGAPSGTDTASSLPTPPVRSEPTSVPTLEVIARLVDSFGAWDFVAGREGASGLVTPAYDEAKKSRETTRNRLNKTINALHALAVRAEGLERLVEALDEEVVARGDYVLEQAAAKKVASLRASLTLKT